MINQVILYNPSLDTMIAAWLHAKAQRSHSDATVKRYQDTLAAFRALLHSQGIDLDGDTALVATIAQGWAAQGKQKVTIAPATYNQRLAVLGSFYAYVIRQGLLRDEEKRLRENPIARIDRSPVQAYANVQPLAYSAIKARLAAIDTSTLEGLRDHAVLWVALTTGRRVSELAAIRRGDIAHDGLHIKMHFPRTKGGKQAYNTLTAKMSQMLWEYLRTLEEWAPHRNPETVWIALGPHNRGGALGSRSLQRICERRLETQHIHALRHTYAHALEQAGAKVSEIQALLGHSNIATTGRYLTSLHSGENPYAEAIEALFTSDE